MTNRSTTLARAGRLLIALATSLTLVAGTAHAGRGSGLPERPVPGAAPSGTTSPPERPVPGAASTRPSPPEDLGTVLMPGTDVEAEFARLLGSDIQVQAMMQEMSRQGWRQRARGGFGLVDGADPAFKLITMDLEKPGTTDIACIGRVATGCGDPAGAYVFSLTATKGDVESVKELFVDGDGKIVPAHSFWTCWKARTMQTCPSACAQAFVSCIPTFVTSGSWQQYLGCVAKACGKCIAKAAACCACNCKVWCKGAVGCCKQ